MNDKVKRVLSTLTLSALVATNAAALMPKVTKAAEVEVEKLAGKDRYETADKINAKLGTKFDKVILTSGQQDNLVDALTAAPLAKKLGAPVVLVDHKTAKAQDVVAKLNGLGAKEVYVVTRVISKDVKDALRNAGMTVKELGGKDRYETAYNIAKELGTSDTAVIVNGVTGMADAMSIAPVAAAKGWPIILATKDDVNDTYKGNYAKYYVIGGTAALSAKVEDKVKGERIFGSDRYETNLNVIKKFKSDINFENVFVARGENDNLVDALVGAAVAASQGSAIVLVNDTITAGMKTELVTAKGIEKAKYTIFGGTVSASAVKTVADEIAKLATVDNSVVNSVSALTVKLNNAIGEKYPDMTLAGNTAQVLVKAVDKEGKPVAGVPVLLEIVKELKNGAVSSKFENSVVYTDKDGIAVGFLKQDAKNVASTVFYKALVVGKDVKPVEGKVQFATLGVDTVKIQYAKDANGEPIKLNPSLNAGKVYEDAVNTKDMNGNLTQYVASQKVSSKSRNNAVTFQVKPTMTYITGTKEEAVDTYKKAINWKSGSYHPYDTFASDYVEVPKGLKYATLYLKNVQLDENAVVEINYFDATKNLIKKTKLKGPRTESNVAIQIPESDIAKVRFVNVVLKTAGQVNTALNGGIELDRIEGVYKYSDVQNNTKTEVLADARINWTVDDVVYSESKTLDITTAAAYGINEPNGVKFVYQVPVFPHTGNAVVTVYDINNKVVAYYTIPTVNNGDNENVLVKPTEYKAVKVSKDEAFNKVGTFTVKDNGTIVTVDSEKVGITNLKGTIEVPGLSKDILNATNSTVYTSVNWAPTTKMAQQQQNDVVAQELFALKGQRVELMAQLTDENGNVATVAGQQVELKYDKENSTGYVNWSSNRTATTNEMGQVKWTVSSADVAFIKDIVAENANYNVKLTIGGKEVTKANIRWLDAYLEHQPKLEGSEYTSQNSSSMQPSEYNVGSAIEYGFIVKARGTDVTVEMKNVPVVFNKVSGTVGSVEKVTDKNYVYLGKSEVAGLQTVDAKIDTIKDASSVKVRYSFNGKDYFDGTFVGTGDIAIYDKLTVKTQWKTVGASFNLIVPQGNVANIKENVTVYVKLVDSYGNALKDKTVKFGVTGANVVDKVETTDNNGVAKVTVKRDTVGQSTIKVEYNGEAKYYSINWRELNADFKMVTASVNSTGNNDVVVLTFSNDVKAETINPKQFTIKTTVNDKEEVYYAIKKAEVVGNQVKLELADSNAKLYTKGATKYTVVYKAFTETEGQYAGIEFKAVNVDGKVLSNDSGVEFVVPANVIMNNISLSGTQLTATIYNADGLYVYVVDSNGKVYEPVKVNGTTATITVDAADSYAVYCNGLVKVYTK